ncbi:Cysteine desulfurase IscS [Phytophthora citrophthora]|uniref:cysteine desulfurase n=1 Tax=Phytophthora citrophthora TaxID=4793 RepID=A0AAD9LBF0_9STRA|nr:Cysteine desulfurase IscS [Phytophthora citrophthora]
MALLTSTQCPSRDASNMTRVYLDYNATTPVEPAVLQALLPFLGPQFGNASSSYDLGQTAKQAVNTARTQVASMLGAADPNEIVFLSGGTESINYAIKGAAMAAKRESNRNHIVTSCVEHVAVLETCKWLETQGFQVTYLPVDRFGCVRVQDVLDALTPQTCVLSIMLANNEVGSLNPVAEISQAVRRFAEEEGTRLPIVVHTDASQAIGKVRVNVQDLGVDLLTIAGHKLYAPKGIGALYLREGTAVDTIIHGASQENGRRGGTENVPLVAALGQACALVEKNLHEYAVIMQESRMFLLEQIQKHCGLTNVSYQVNGHPELSLPNTLSISFENINAPRILDLIEADGVYASAGSACHSHKSSSNDKEKKPESQEEHITISHVLAAMNVAPEFAKGTLRLSVGRSTTQEELLYAANSIHKAIQQLL